MAKLRTDPNLTDPDGFYEALITAQEGLPAAAADQLKARLILLLANHIGDDETLREAVALAREGLEKKSR
ncbi:DUF2783 domain-containing protein [Desertibaculum subflavum]|uniref:DUF2783 domain-containing protein n=1 Tax=Desertibaculum subflavum TaxID=2268458 RepID=UPI000E668C41